MWFYYPLMHFLPDSYQTLCYVFYFNNCPLIAQWPYEQFFYESVWSHMTKWICISWTMEAMIQFSYICFHSLSTSFICLFDYIFFLNLLSEENLSVIIILNNRWETRVVIVLLNVLPIIYNLDFTPFFI